MDKSERQITQGNSASGKNYGFDEAHNPRLPAEFWFQESEEGKILFIVFYSQACRWSRCLGCNLPSKMSLQHVDFQALMSQVDHLMSDPGIMDCRDHIRKVIISNNGSVLDEETFSSTALMYLIARLNQYLPQMAVLTLETRAEYVDEEELGFLARSLREGHIPTQLEIAIGFEAFDDKIRNDVFNKGLALKTFENLCRMVAVHGFNLKCYFMQKPVPGMSDLEAVEDIHRAIDYLNEQAKIHDIQINMHLNPTYVAHGTSLVESFEQGTYSPPYLLDVVRAALHARDKRISLYLGLSDEGLAVEGGSFIRPGEDALIEQMNKFNTSQDYNLLAKLIE